VFSAPENPLHIVPIIILYQKTSISFRTEIESICRSREKAFYGHTHKNYCCDNFSQAAAACFMQVGS
jgi:hypothetical protein